MSSIDSAFQTQRGAQSPDLSFVLLSSSGASENTTSFYPIIGKTNTNPINDSQEAPAPSVAAQNCLEEGWKGCRELIPAPGWHCQLCCAFISTAVGQISCKGSKAAPEKPLENSKCSAHGFGTFSSPGPAQREQKMLLTLPVPGQGHSCSQALMEKWQRSCLGTSPSQGWLFLLLP